MILSQATSLASSNKHVNWKSPTGMTWHVMIDNTFLDSLNKLNGNHVFRKRIRQIIFRSNQSDDGYLLQLEGLSGCVEINHQATFFGTRRIQDAFKQLA